MSQFHKPRETDYYLWVPTELVVFQEPVFFFFDWIKTFFKKREREWERARERGRAREEERERGQRQREGRKRGLAGATRPLDGSVSPQSAPRPRLATGQGDWLKDGTVNKAESSFLKSSYPTLRPPRPLCPQLFHPPARTRRRDKRGSPRMASLLLTAQGSDYSSVQPHSQSTGVLSTRLDQSSSWCFLPLGVCNLHIPHRAKHVATLGAENPRSR